MASRSNEIRRRRLPLGARCRTVAAILAVVAMLIGGVIATIQPPTTQAIICVGIGRIIGISDCFTGGYGHFPPPGEYAPLPEDYAPPPPPPPTTTTTTPAS